MKGFGFVVTFLMPKSCNQYFFEKQFNSKVQLSNRIQTKFGKVLKKVQ